MTDQQNNSSPDFDAKEVDNLIANFGVKPSPEKREELHQMLGAQKEQFIKSDLQQINDQDKDRSGR
jgi:recombinational DNA repair protein RecT